MDDNAFLEMVGGKPGGRLARMIGFLAKLYSDGGYPSERLLYTEQMECYREEFNQKFGTNISTGPLWREIQRLRKGGCLPCSQYKCSGCSKRKSPYSWQRYDSISNLGPDVPDAVKLKLGGMLMAEYKKMRNDGIHEDDLPYTERAEQIASILSDATGLKLDAKFVCVSYLCWRKGHGEEMELAPKKKGKHLADQPRRRTRKSAGRDRRSGVEAALPDVRKNGIPARDVGGVSGDGDIFRLEG